MINKPILIALNTSTYTVVEVPTAVTNLNNDVHPISFYTEDESSFYIAVDAAGAGEALVPEKKVVNIEKVKTIKSNVLFYAKATAGTPNLVLLIGTR